MKKYLSPALILLSITLMVYGYLGNEVKMMLSRSISLCLECIGIG